MKKIILLLAILLMQNMLCMESNVESKALFADDNQESEELARKVRKALGWGDETIFDTHSKDYYEACYAEAPIEIKAVVEFIKSCDSEADFYKDLMLAGESGFGKVMMAKAIAYQLIKAGITKRVRSIDATSFLGNIASQQELTRWFQEAQCAQDVILIVDGINTLPEMSVIQLCTLLGMRTGEDNCIFIGIMNKLEPVSPKLIEYFEGKIFEVNDCDHYDKMNISTCLADLKSMNVIVDKSCDENYLTQLQKRLKGYSKRRINTIFHKALLLHKMDKIEDDKKILTPTHLDAAIEAIKKEAQGFKRSERWCKR